MNSALLLCSLVLAQAGPSQAEVSVGGTTLTLPAPADFALVTDEMQDYLNYSERFVPDINQQLAQFLPPDLMAQVKAGQMPVDVRKGYVQILKASIPLTATSASFEQVKRAMRSEAEQMKKAIESQAPDLTKKINDGFAKDNIDVKLSLGQTVPLPAHYETERCLSFTMLVSFEVQGPDGTVEPVTGAVTTSLVHVRGKVLYLYVNADRKEIAWAEQVSRAWADAVIAANPSDAATAERERGPVRDWNNQAFQSGLIGGVIGGLFAAFHFLRKKKTAAKVDIRDRARDDQAET